MQCDTVIFSEHAFTRMAERDIEPKAVVQATKTGKIIKEYPDDEPSPSFLLLGFLNESPLHVVVSRDYATDICIVITVYAPDPTQWGFNFSIKKSKP